jgi:hypothetical protein
MSITFLIWALLLKYVYGMNIYFYRYYFKYIFNFIHLLGDIYVCSAGDPTLIGKYSPGAQFNDAPTYTNENDMSFFRNKGFWYLGNLASWPPVTHYRCVDSEGCNYMLDYPSDSNTGSWTINKKFGKEPFPQFSTVPCSNAADEL